MDKFNDSILACIEHGSSIQSILVEIVRDFITFEYFRAHLTVNAFTKFLNAKYLKCAADLGNLDDIEARHALDQIIMYSGL